MTTATAEGPLQAEEAAMREDRAEALQLQAAVHQQARVARAQPSSLQVYRVSVWINAIWKRHSQQWAQSRVQS